MSSVKMKPNARPRQRLREKLDTFRSQKIALFAHINESTERARQAAEDLLQTDDGAVFQGKFMKVMQDLEHDMNALALLADNAESLFDSINTPSSTDSSQSLSKKVTEPLSSVADSHLSYSSTFLHEGELTGGRTADGETPGGSCGSVASLVVAAGQEFLARVTFMESPHRFWIQPYGTMLNQLMIKLRDYFALTGLQGNHIVNPRVGMLCVCEFSADRSLYRARITRADTDQSGMVEVYYLDYGNSEVVSLSKIWCLPSQFTQLPAQSICCALAKVAPPFGVLHWSPRISQEVLKIVNKSVLRCLVCESSNSPLPIVKLFLPSHDHGDLNDTSLSDILVAKGLALNFVSSSQISLFSQMYSDLSQNVSPQGTGDNAHSVERLPSGMASACSSVTDLKPSVSQKINFDLSKPTINEDFEDGNFDEVIPVQLPPYVARSVPRLPSSASTSPKPTPTKGESNLLESKDVQSDSVKPMNIPPPSDPLTSIEQQRSNSRDLAETTVKDELKGESVLNAANFSSQKLGAQSAEKSSNLSSQKLGAQCEEKSSNLSSEKLGAQCEEKSSNLSSQKLGAQSAEKYSILSSQKLDSGIESNPVLPEAKTSHSFKDSMESIDVKGKQSLEKPSQNTEKPSQNTDKQVYKPPYIENLGQSGSVDSFFSKPTIFSSQQTKQLKPSAKKKKGDPKDTPNDNSSSDLCNKLGKVKHDTAKPDLHKEPVHELKNTESSKKVDVVKNDTEVLSETKDSNIDALEEKSLSKQAEDKIRKNKPGSQNDYHLSEEKAISDRPTSPTKGLKSETSADSLREELRQSMSNLAGPSLVSLQFTKLLESIQSVVRSEPINVMLSYVESPSNFFVHCAATGLVGQALTELEESLHSYFSSKTQEEMQKLSSELNLSVGSLCCSIFSEDGNFYRAEVIKIHESNPTILVNYIDFGNSETLSAKSLYPLPDHLSDLQAFPRLAVRCELACVSPADCDLLVGQSNRTSATWSTEAVTAFESLFGYEKVLQMVHVPSQESSVASEEVDDDSPVPILLLDQSTKPTVILNASLVEKGLAWFVKPPEDWLEKGTTGDSQKLDQWNPAEEDYLADLNSYEVDLDDPGVATVGIKVEDERNICRYYRTKKGCNRGNRCPLRHVLPQPGSYTQDRTEVISMVNEPDIYVPLPEEGSWVGAEVTAIYTPVHFYIVLPWGNKSLLDTSEEERISDEGYAGSSNGGENLEELVESMTEHYQRLQFRDNKLLMLAEGEVVAARYTHDNMWYRAKVVRRETDQMIKLFYLDFGNTEVVNESRIRSMDPQFLHMPFQAVECHLPGIKPKHPQTTWSSESKRCFNHMVDGKTLAVFIIGRCKTSASLEVVLYNTNDDEDINISEAMIEAGYAEPQERPKPETTGNFIHPGGLANLTLVPG